MQVLIIDGPARGTIRDVRQERFIAIEGQFIGVGAKTVYYYVHRYHLLGRIVRVASVHRNQKGIDPEDAFNVMASQLTKQAASRPIYKRSWKEVITDALRPTSER